MAAPVDVNELGFTVLHEASHPKVEYVLYTLLGHLITNNQKYRVHPRLYRPPTRYLGSKTEPTNQRFGREAWAVRR